MNLPMRIIATVVVAIPVASTVFAHGQGVSPEPATPSVREPMKTPKVDIFLGYSYLRAVPELADGNRLVDLNGGSASIAFNLGRYFALVGDFGGYDDTRLRLAGPGANPPTVLDSGGSAFTYLFGPRLSFRNHSRVTPFAQILFGAAHAGEVTLSGCTGASCTPLSAQTSFALTAGGGFDIRLARHISLRAIQAEYLMTRFSDPTTAAGNTQNDLRLSTGLLFRLGGHPAWAPAAAPNRSFAVECSTDSQTAYAGAGEPVVVRAHASAPASATLSYTWTADGGSVEGSGAEARWNVSATPGAYTVSTHVDDGHGGTGDCSSNIRVEQKIHPPPTMVCSADRSSVAAGEPVQVTATAGNAEQDTLTYSWSASGGNIVGSGSSVKLDTTGLSTGRYTVTGHVGDARGGNADCSVDVDTQAPTALEVRLALHSIYFPTAQPTTDDPTAGLLTSQKQMLMALAGDFKSYLESKPDAHLILEGHADPRGSDQYNQALSQRRVQAAKRFLTDRGLPAANIETRAVGMEQNLSAQQVQIAVEQNPELSGVEKQKMLDNMTTILLASNRRVDITLSTTGQQSARQYPFNAVDSLALLNQEEAPAKPRRTTKKKATSAPE